MQTTVQDSPIVTKATAERLWSPNLLLTYLATFASFGSHMILLSTLPLYVLEKGGAAWQIGLVIGAFNLAPLFLRPLVGWWISKWGKKPFLLLGCLIFSFSPASFILAGNVLHLTVLRLFQGIGIAAFPTAATTLVADFAPVKRRGEAVGYYGMFIALSQALLPALGFFILTTWNFSVLFLSSAGLGLISLALSSRIQVPPLASSPPAQKRGTILQSLINRRALFPSLVFLSFTITFGGLAAFLPLLTVERGLGNPGLYFAIQGFVTIVVRSVAGTLSDRRGRSVVIIPGLATAATAMYILVMASSLPVFLASAFLYGIGFGAAQTGLMALTIDRVPAHERPSGMATFQWMWDIGGSSGAIFLGFLAASVSFAVVFGITGSLTTIGLISYLVISYRQARANRKAPLPAS